MRGQPRAGAPLLGAYIIIYSTSGRTAAAPPGMEALKMRDWEIREKNNLCQAENGVNIRSTDNYRRATCTQDASLSSAVRPRTWIRPTDLLTFFTGTSAASELGPINTG